MAVPDFLAGFVYGMVGDNKLTEIEACATGFEVMGPEIEAGIADLKKGGTDNDIQAALQFGLVALQVPQALKTCEGMGDDLAAIEAWAQIFTNPTSLAAAVSKHYLFHKSEIQADITALETDWTAQKYFTAGSDLAALLTLAVGPIQSTLGDAAPQYLLPDLFAGWISGVDGDAPFADDAALKSYMEGCFVLDATVSSALDTAIGLFDLGGEDNIKAGVQDLLAVVPQIFAGYSGCSQESANVAAIQSYYTYIMNMNPDVRFTMVLKNLQKNYGTVKADYKVMSDDYSAGDYFGVGKMASTVANMIIPVPASDYFLQ